MLNVFENVKGLIKTKLDKVCIDNRIFWLHYKATATILIAFSLIVTAKEYIGEPIVCTVIKDEVPQKVMDTFCWIHSTFTLPNQNGRIGMDVVQPGVAPQTDRDEVKYHQYYQWVCFTLFFQAILFYAPRFIWKTVEGGRIKMLAQDLNCPIVKQECKDDRIRLLVNYFTTNLHQQNLYALCFFMCEALNFVNVVGQIYLMDRFLGGEFSTYGFDVLKYIEMEPIERDDPMSRVFPKVTKCTFHKFGPSGTVQTFDSLCILPLNVVNEKIYVFLWFWFKLLSIGTGLMMVYRVCVICFMKIRVYLLFSRAHRVLFVKIETITRMFQIGDWFILYQLSKNIDPLIFGELISNLAKTFEVSEGVNECDNCPVKFGVNEQGNECAIPPVKCEVNERVHKCDIHPVTFEVNEQVNEFDTRRVKSEVKRRVSEGAISV